MQVRALPVSCSFQISVIVGASATVRRLFVRATQKTNRFSRASECRIALRIKRSQTHILVAAALGACAPLAEVSKTEPKLGAQYGTIAELRRAEQAIAEMCASSSAKAKSGN